MEQLPFQSELIYSVQNEDYRTELAVLQRVRRDAPLRVLMVASSGENALSVLTEDAVGAVCAVDINEAQLHLSELRRTAAQVLSRDEQLALLGADPALVGAGGAPGRLALYDRLRPGLPEAARAHWDARRERDIAFGVQHVGRNDVLMRDIQASLMRHSFKLLPHNLSEDDFPAWREAYGEVMTVAYFREKFGLPNEAVAGRLAALTPRIAECHFRAVRAPSAERNYFLTTALLNRYAEGEEGLPRYLQNEGLAALRRLGTGRLQLRTGSIFDQAVAQAREGGRFDLISISNIPDWMDAEQFGATVIAMQDCLGPSGALLARTVNDSRMIADVIGRHMTTDAAFNHSLAAAERGPWFRVVAAGFRAD